MRNRIRCYCAALAVVVLAAAPLPSRAQSALPDGVPNVLDPRVQGEYQAFQVGNLEGNPNFPVVAFMSQSNEKREAVVLALDARNGKETWSIRTDPVILVAVFSQPQTIANLFLDRGFADRGEASGAFMPADGLHGDLLPHLLETVAGAREQIYM